MKKPTKKQIKEYFGRLDEIESEMWSRVLSLESLMQKETGIKNIEFFWNDGSVVGIGTSDRKMKLIHRG